MTLLLHRLQSRVMSAHPVAPVPHPYTHKNSHLWWQSITKLFLQSWDILFLETRLWAAGGIWKSKSLKWMRHFASGLPHQTPPKVNESLHFKMPGATRSVPEVTEIFCILTVNADLLALWPLTTVFQRKKARGGATVSYCSYYSGQWKSTAILTSFFG